MTWFSEIICIEWWLLPFEIDRDLQQRFYCWSAFGKAFFKSKLYKLGSERKEIKISIIFEYWGKSKFSSRVETYMCRKEMYVSFIMPRYSIFLVK